MSIWLPTPGVFIFDCTREQLRRLRVIAARAVEVPGGPNTMNKYGRTLDDRNALQACVAFSRMIVWDNIDARVHLGVQRTQRAMSAFTIEYDATKQRRLTRHRDSSDITLNVCLDGVFTGGSIVFCGPGGGRTEVEQRVGRGFVHLGALEHRAVPITSGTRRNLVLWWRRGRT